MVTGIQVVVYTSYVASSNILGANKKHCITALSNSCNDLDEEDGEEDGVPDNVANNFQVGFSQMNDDWDTGKTCILCVAQIWLL